MSVGGKLSIYINFLINQDYIAQNLCENKDKPVLKCNGKCQLAKELAKEEKKEKKDNKTNFEDKINYYFCSFDAVVELKPVFYEKKEHNPAPVPSNLVGFAASVFHPPSHS